MKITDRILGALQDVHDNHGTMWRVSTGWEARKLWDELEELELVEFNQWNGTWQLNEAGRRALQGCR